MALPLKIFRVKDHSMEPTINEGDYVVVSRIHAALRIGDIVILTHPTNGQCIIKRVKGIDSGLVFVVGDNQKVSEDSRAFGSIKTGKIFGKVIYKV